MTFSPKATVILFWVQVSIYGAIPFLSTLVGASSLSDWKTWTLAAIALLSGVKGKLSPGQQ